MSNLVLAIAPESLKAVEALLREHTAGRWARWISIQHLDPKRKEINDSELHELASRSDTPIFASAAQTSSWLTLSHTQLHRFKRDELHAALVKWLDDNKHSWNSGFKSLEGLSGFQVGDEAKWRGQFSKVDPRVGPRVAKALLAQLRVVRMNELVDYLTEGPPFSYNIYFTGDDRHSGDFAMVSPLASRLDGDTLWEAQDLPDTVPDGAQLRLFSDGSWSGGETEKRIKCLTAKCTKKAAYVRGTHSLQVSVAFATTQAMSRVTRRGEKLQNKGLISGLEIRCPNVLDMQAGRGLGLAFAEDDINDFVDPDNPRTYYEFCKALGEMVYPSRPLGTDGIASTVAFEHSLPKAMLPFFIFGGAPVRAADGTTFSWTPLLHSKHVQRPAKNNPEHHCTECPLAPKPKNETNNPDRAAKPQLPGTSEPAAH